MLSSATVLLALSISAFAAPIQIQRREVPQEHSHEPFLKAVSTLVNTNNPDQLGDAVFGLLGNAAAAKGLGKTTDPDCLQQALADRAFTNAKANGDVDGQVSALIYRALERNSGSVGAVSNKCTSVQAVNPEIAAIQQHQDPASDNAAATNKAIVLELAKQIASVGGNPLDALQSGTFAPGQIGDPTAKGNTCDDIVDAGCIVAQNLLVEDATADEINAAVAGISSGNAGNNNNAGNNGNAGNKGNAGNAGSSTSTDNANTGAANSNVGDFGKCSVPQIEFGQGFDNRKETSFQPVDKASFNHGSAQAIGIIAQFICDTLTNSCGADQTAKDTCKQAQTAAGAATAKTGAQADAFNAAFGIKTNFANVQPIDDQGRAVGSVKARAAGNFGKCSVPQIEFGQGFDNRKETSFQPVDKASFNHGSAQAIGIIAQFICDTLTNSCGADQAAKDTCKQAQTAAGAAAAKTGAQADAFNAAFGIKTNFANVQPIDDQGRVVGAAAAGAAAGNANAGNANAGNANAGNANAGNANAGNAANGSSGAASGNLQTFTGALGGATAPAVTPGGKGFQVAGSDDFLNVGAALGRSCDIQHNACANAANSGGGFSVSDCDQQNSACRSAISN